MPTRSQRLDRLKNLHKVIASYVHKTVYEKAKSINNEEVQEMILCLKEKHDEGQEREKNVQIQKKFNFLCVKDCNSN